MAKHKNLQNQQKHTDQTVIQGQPVYLLLVIVLGISRQVLIIIVQMFFVVLNELILFKLVKSHSIITVFQFQLMIL